MRGVSFKHPLRAMASIVMLGAMIVSCAPTQGAPSGGQAPGGQTAVKEQIFRYPVGPIRYIDPGLATDNISNDVLTKLFDGLVELDKNSQIKPQLAERWESSTDAKTYTFFIRSGAKWTDGRPITAGDFEFALKRVLDPKTASEYANTLYSIKGAEKFHKGGGTAADVAVRAKDDRTLEIQLEEAAGYFITLATTWTFNAVPKHVVERFGDKWTDAANVVSSGPFKVKEWLQDQRLVAVRNEEYWGSKPALTQIVYRIFPDGPDQANQILRAYENDELDSTGTFDVPPSEVDRVLRDPKLGKEVAIFDYSRATWVCFNNAKKPFDDVRVRKALGISLERKKLLEQVLKSIEKPADDLIPSGIIGRNPSAWPKEDLNEAKKLLSDAGYPNGQGFPEVTYVYNSSTLNKLAAEYLQGRWKEALNINVKLEAMEFAQFLPFRRGNKTYDMFRCSWGSDFEDPYNWFNTLFDSKSDQQQQTTNYKSAEFDALVARAATNTNAADRKKQYEDANAMLARDYFSAPLWLGARRVLVKPYVQNLVVGRLAGGTLMRDVSLNK